MPCHDRSTSATAATRTGKGVKQRELDVVREGQPPLQHLVPQLNRLCQLAAPPAGADDVAVGRLLRGGTRRGAGKGSSGSVISAGVQGWALRYSQPAQLLRLPPFEGASTAPAPAAAHIGLQAAALHLLEKVHRIPQLTVLHARKQACGQRRVRGKGGEAGRAGRLVVGWVAQVTPADRGMHFMIHKRSWHAVPRCCIAAGRPPHQQQQPAAGRPHGPVVRMNLSGRMPLRDISSTTSRIR
jgi:hypothetical protein